MKNIFILFILCFGVNLAFGQSLEELQSSQANRIQKAFKAGKLTELELDKLNKEQETIKNTIEIAKADGIFSPDEKNAVRGKLNRAEKRLLKYQSNGEVY